jgi:zinc/manganese transport system substrate-binding protein
MEISHKGPRGFGVRALCVTFLFAICLQSFAAEKKLRIVTTIFPVYCFASQVLGFHGEVQNLLPPNVGPHDYQLSPSDLRKLKDADLVIFNGAGLDNWITKAADKNRLLELGRALKSEIIESSPDLDLAGSHEHSHDHHHGPGNPHFWLDPQLAIRCVTNILASVQTLDPARSADYAKNAEAYIERLKALDGEIASKLAPVKDKPFITQHDAFPYLIRRYQLKLAGVIELTPDVSPSPRYLRDLLKVIRKKKVQVLFTDPQTSGRLARQIAKDANVRTADLQTLESGPLDAKGYEQGMLRNAETLARELKK